MSTTRPSAPLSGSSTLAALAVVALVFAASPASRTTSTVTSSQTADGDTPPVGIYALEQRVGARLRSTQPPVAPLTGPLRIRAVDIEWSIAGAAPLLEVDSLRATLASASLLEGEVIIPHLDIFSPTLRLARAQGAEAWNFEPALAMLSSGRGAEGQARRGTARHLILIEDAAIHHGSVTITPPSGDVVEVRDLEAEAPRIILAGPDQREPVAEVARIAATISLPREDLILPLLIERSELAFPPDRLDFTAARITIAHSLLTDAVGVYHFGAPGLGLDLTAHGERIELADLGVLTPRAPREGVASFELRLSTDAGGRSTLALSGLELVAAGSQIHGSLSLAFGGGAPFSLLGVDLSLDPLTIALIEEFTGPLPYGGELRGRIRGPPGRIAFDLIGRLTAPGVAGPFTAGLVGEAAFAEGVQLTSLEADLRRVPLIALRPFVPGLSVEGVVSGHVSFRGTPGRVPIALDVRLEVAAGVITLAGAVDLTGAAPRYDLHGTLVGIRLDDLLERPVPPVSLYARFDLSGTGTEPVTALARLRLEGQFTEWITGPADSIRVIAALERGTLALDTAAVLLGPLDFAASGDWHFERPAAGGLHYRLAVSNLTPFAPYLPLILGNEVAAGALLAAGELSGPRVSPRLDGTLSASDLIYDGVSADSLSASYDLVLERPLETATVHLTATGLETPLGPYTQGTANLDLAGPLIAFDLTAEGAAGNGPLIVRATGRAEPDGMRDITVERLRFDLDGTTWALARPAQLQWGAGPEITIEDLLIHQVDGTGQLAISGHYPPSDAGEILVDATDLPVADILIIAGYEPIVMGSLSVDLRVQGPPTDARAGGTFTLTNGSFRGQAIAGLQGDFLAEDRRLEAQAIAQLDTAGNVRLSASIPLVIDLSGIPDFTIPRTEPMRASVVADSLSLGLLALGTPELQRVTGRLTADVELMGTPERPILTGEARVTDGAATVVPLRRRYDRISGLFTLSGETVRVDDLLIHSDGWATIEGTVNLAEIENPAFDLVALFDGFRAGGGGDLEPAAVDGELTLTGTLERPVIAGAVTVDHGNIDIGSFQSGGGAGPVGFASSTLEAAPTIEAVPAPGTLADAIAGEFGPGPAPAVPSLFDRLIIDDVVVTAGQNLWFVTDQFRAQLAGELGLNKEDTELEIAGELEGDRGVFTLEIGPIVRRFTLEHASVRFFGTPELNPALDVTASRFIPGAAGQMTEIILHLTGTLNQPRVAVRTADGAQVPETELVSFLLFGRPSYAAPGQFPLGGPLLEEAFFGIGSVAELASIGIEEALISDLGLPIDYFLIQPTTGPFGGLGAPTIVLGEEIAPNVFLTVNTGIGGLFGAAANAANAWAVTLQWRITSQWTLELGIVPVNPARFFRGLGTALPIVGFERQLIVELQRRWTY